MLQHGSNHHLANRGCLQWVLAITTVVTILVTINPFVNPERNNFFGRSVSFRVECVFDLVTC